MFMTWLCGNACMSGHLLLPLSEYCLMLPHFRLGWLGAQYSFKSLNIFLLQYTMMASNSVHLASGQL
jgi:hypothetical protein